MSDILCSVDLGVATASIPLELYESDGHSYVVIALDSKRNPVYLEIDAALIKSMEPGINPKYFYSGKLIVRAE